ncbi:hypothetical protein C2I18_01065 [Paenibacillus sp. PK3_47]|uniref:carbohydrate binding domain-containing protein n=1 Tax=Paenibacillus sp. PK3_47 TaxID=2072642 RepID=UPI00201D8679|nr:carbohydrate binding domain-containing protein [Paenibacillus sp. PK3_47]UQZ32257.1 hypothetical protein C2I18_01065 [Paenibacillus sp. PK3_47]
MYRNKFIGFGVQLFSLCILVIIMYPNEIQASSNSNNLISNPGFENQAGNEKVAVDWERQGSGIFEVIQTPVSEGLRAQKITVSNLPEGQIAAVKQNFTVTPGEPFSLSGRFYIESISNAKVQLYADFYKEDAYLSSTIFELPSHSTGQYITLGGNAQVPNDATSVAIHCLIRSTSTNGSGSFIADSVRFIYTNDTNLIANADFETSTTPLSKSDDWDYTTSYNPVFDSITSPTMSGNRAQKITGSSLPNNQYVGILQKIKVEPGEHFQVNGAISINSLINAKAQLYIDFMTPTGYSGASIIEHHTVTNGEYITLSSTGLIPNDTTYAVVYVLIRSTSNNGSGTVFVDSLDFKYSEEANNINNGNFESQGSSVLAKGWIPSFGNGSYKTQLFRDEKKNHVQKIEASNISADAAVGVSQILKVIPNQKYTISGRIKIDNLSNAKVQLYADFMSQGSYLGANIVELPSTTYGGYTTVSNTGTVPRNAETVRLYALIRATNNNGAAVIYIDDMIFSYNSNLLSNSDFEVSNIGTEEPKNWTVIQQQGSESEIQLVEDIPVTYNTVSQYSQAGRLTSMKFMHNGQPFNTLFKYDLNGNQIKKINIKSALNNQQVLNGKKSQKVAAQWIPNNEYVGVSQSLRVLPNKTYTIAGNINASMLYQAKVQMYIDFYSANGSYIANSIKELNEVTNGFKLLTNQGTIPPSAVSATVYFLIRSTGEDGAGMFFLDSVSFSYN